MLQMSLVLLVSAMTCSCKSSDGDSAPGTNGSADARAAEEEDGLADGDGESVAENAAGEACAVRTADGVVVLEGDIELSGSPADFTLVGADGSQLRSSGEGNRTASQLSGVLVTIDGTRLETDTGCSLDLGTIWQTE